MFNKLNKRTKHYLIGIIGIMMFFIVLSLLLFGIKTYKIRSLELDSNASGADNTHNWSGNIVAVCEYNGPSFLNELIGGTLKLISIPDGKESTIVKNRGFLEGFGNPIICGDTIYYTTTWDGQDGADYYFFNLKENFNGKFIDYLIYEEPFYVTEEKIYYLDDEEDFETEEARRYLIEYSISSREKTILIEKYIKYFTIYNDLIYYFDKEGNLFCQNISEELPKQICNIGTSNVYDMIITNEGNVYIQTEKDGLLLYEVKSDTLSLIADNGNFSNRIWGYNSSLLYFKEGVLYYCDSKGNIYSRDAEGTHERIIGCLINSSFLEGQQTISWCKDYIVLQVSTYNLNSNYKRGELFAYDYNGMSIFSKQNMNFI